MCLTSSLLGVLVFVKRRSLLSEALSHAAYPGVAISVLLTSMFFAYSEELIALSVLVGASLSSLIGLYLIEKMKSWKVADDAAMTFVLSAFLGVGILLVSYLQQTKALWYQQIQLFLYGQIATMREGHVVIYLALALITLTFVTFFYHLLLSSSFDTTFSRSVGLPIRRLNFISFSLLVLSIVIGIRSVGVVLMSGMLIAPALAAKAWTASLSKMLLLAALFGLISAYFGALLSDGLPMNLPAGPLIVLVAGTIALISLILSPSNGALFRIARILKFRTDILRENILKLAWKNEGRTTTAKIRTLFPTSSLLLKLFLLKMAREGYIEKRGRAIVLTKDGERRAARVVRLHRLWEVYLFDVMGSSEERVHTSACEMEHIITPELEEELSSLLGHPKVDPHKQPIPQEEPL